MFAAWALHHGDMEVVQGSHVVSHGVELREGVVEPREQLCPRSSQGFLPGRFELRADDAHRQGVHVAAHYVCTKAGGLDQRGTAAGEGIEHSLTGERTLRGAEHPPEVLCRRVGVEMAGNEQPPKQGGGAPRPPSVDAVDRVARSSVGADHEGEFSKRKALLQQCSL
jgi:hypothetical protein